MACSLAFCFTCICAQAVTFTSNTHITDGNTNYNGQAIVVDACTLTVDGTHPFSSISVINGAVLTHSIGVSGLVLNVANTITVSSNSSIDVTACGEVLKPETDFRAGGSYGGRGEPGYSYGYKYSCDVYGDAFEPVDLGSGGNGSANRGGGAVKLTADTLQLDGALRADGQDASEYTGGGSGGSIWLDVDRLQGAGVIQANGGLHGSSAGDGGGGRISICYNDADRFDLSSVQCAAVNSGAGAGTLYLKDNAESYGQLVLDNQGYSHSSAIPSLLNVSSNQFDRLSVSGKARLVLTVAQPLTLSSCVVSDAFSVVTGDVTGPALNLIDGDWTQNGSFGFSNTVSLTGASTLRHAAGYSNGLQIAAHSVAVSSNSAIDVTACGGIPKPETDFRAGGSYGGRGEPGYSYGYKYSCDVYGNVFEPVDLGSGGNGSANRGGGAMKLTADTLQLDGALRADGQDASEYTGGGSGGSIWLDVDRLQGAGVIQANGGLHGSSAGDGGGGRISICYNDADRFDLSSVQCAAVNSGAGAGTVYLKDNAESYGQLVLDNQSYNHSSAIPSLLNVSSNQFDRLSVSGKARLVLTVDQPLTLSSCVISDAFAVVTGDVTGPALNLVDGDWTQNGRFGFSNTVSLTGASTLRHAAGYSNGLQIAAHSVAVSSNSAIDVSACGEGPKPETELRAGGSYGGRGEPFYNYGYYYSCAVYGDAFEPVDLGSGGRGSGNRGGGAVKLTADTLQLDGALRADGQNGGEYTGGGSGGSIWLVVDRLEGAGAIQSNGGLHGSNSGDSGDGGGGRIAICYNDADRFDLSSVLCAAVNSGAGAGTLYLKDNAEFYGRMVLDNQGYSHSSAIPSLLNVSSNQFDRLSVSGKARLILTVDQPLTLSSCVVSDAFSVVTGDVTGPALNLVDGDWTQNGSFGFSNTVSLTGASTLRHAAGYSNGLQIAAHSVAVSSNSAIDVTACGNGPQAGTSFRAGGSYGGEGEANYGGTLPTYGDAFEPVDLGSGGNGSANRGGGAVKLTADTLQLDGALCADGQDGGDYTGGGSGGSIWLDVNRLHGAGAIQANGGLHGSSAGDGGGGRVALYFEDISGFNSMVIESKAGSGADWGTVFLAGPRHVTVRTIGPGTANPTGTVVVAYGDTNLFSFLPDQDSEMDGAFANGDYLGSSMSEYGWVNNGLLRGTMDDNSWYEHLLYGDLLEVVFFFRILAFKALNPGCTVSILGASNWLYSLGFKNQLSEETWTPVAGQQDVPCSKDGLFHLTDDEDRTQAFYRVQGRPAP